MKVLDGGKAQRRAKAQQLLMKAIMTGDDTLYDQLEAMARRDVQRADLRLINESSDDTEARQPRSGRPSPR